MKKVKITARVIQGLKPKTVRYEVHDQELKGFYVRVTPGGQLTYYQTYFLKGKRERFSLGDAKILTVAQAKERAMQVLGEAAKGEDPKSEKKLQKIPTMLDFIEQDYGSWLIANRKSGQATVNHLRCRVYSDFHSKQLNQINPWLIEKWRTKRRKDKICFSTINRDVSRLRALLYKAVEWGIISEHPFSQVKQYREDSLKKVRYLTDEEEKSLRDVIDQRENEIREKRIAYNTWREERGYPLYPDLKEQAFVDYLKPMILISINTGLRRGELFDLEWSDIDFQRKMLTVNGERTKSGKTRYIPLNKEAFEVMFLWHQQTNSKTKRVFESKDGGRFCDVKKAWHRLLKIAEIENFRWHDMRHHFASRLVMAGVDLNTVRELLGHGDMKMTLRYAHLSPEIKAEAVARLDSAPEPILKPQYTPQNRKILNPERVLI